MANRARIFRPTLVSRKLASPAMACPTITECTPTKKPDAKLITSATTAVRIRSSAALELFSISAFFIATTGIRSTVANRLNTTAQTLSWAARNRNPDQPKRAEVAAAVATAKCLAPRLPARNQSG